MGVLTLEQHRTDYSLIRQKWVQKVILWKRESAPHNLNSTKQTKGTITLTVAAVILFSGLWGSWYTPTSTYEPRKNEQIGNIEFILKSDTSTVKAIDLEQGIKEISIGIVGQRVVEDYDANQSLDIPPIFSARILDSQGK